MQETRQTKWHWLKAVGGLLTVWLLLSGWHVTPPSSTADRGYVSYDKPRQLPHKPDVTSVVWSQGPTARVSPRSGMSFGPSPGWLPCLLPAFGWVVNAQLAGQAYSSHYSFRFLRLIFEHQIAINAP